MNGGYTPGNVGGGWSGSEVGRQAGSETKKILQFTKFLKLRTSFLKHV